MSPTLTRRWLAGGGALAAVFTSSFIVLGLWPELGWDTLEAIVLPGGGGATLAARMSTAVAGCLGLGLAITAALLAPLAGTPAAPVAGRAITIGVLVWYVTDGAISIGFGGWLNAVNNTGFVICLLPPALAMWRRAPSPQNA